MSDNFEHLDIDSEDFEDAPRALRDYAKKLKKALDSTRQERDQFQSQLASRSVGEVLGDKGFKNPKRVERDLISDGVDPLDSQAIARWLEENGDDYAKGSAEPETPTPEQTAEVAAQAEAQERMSLTGTSPADLSKWDLVQQQITPDMDGAAVAALYAKHGV